MHRVLTEKEALEGDLSISKESNDWWLSLSIRDKKSIYNYHKDILKQVKCVHQFRKIDYYSQKIETCDKCGYNRDLSESRDEKIKEII